MITDPPDNIMGLLPETVRHIVTIIGLPAALQLIDVWGGTTFPVSLNLSREGQIRFEMLADTVGVEAAQILTDHFGGETLYIPRCIKLLREIRDRQLRADFDRLTLIEKNTATQAVIELVKKYRLSDRHIMRILKQPDIDINTNIINTIGQVSLF